MLSTPDKAISDAVPQRRPAPLWQRLLLRILFVLVVGTAVGFLLNYSAESLAKRTAPASFEHGVLHGALMPCAMPALLIGHDVQIYALHNTGRLYKLGYTLGVIGCGAIFFGFFYRRLGRWRRGAAP